MDDATATPPPNKEQGDTGHESDYSGLSDLDDISLPGA